MPTATTFNTLFSENSVRQPCKRDCPDRSPGCGSSCQKWSEYLKRRSAVYQRRELDSDRYASTKRGVITFNRAPKRK